MLTLIQAQWHVWPEIRLRLLGVALLLIVVLVPDGNVPPPDHASAGETSPPEADRDNPSFRRVHDERQFRARHDSLRLLTHKIAE